MRDDYRELGYVVLRGLIDPSLLGDLQIAADQVRAVTHTTSGRQAQRSELLCTYGDQVDLDPFERYLGSATLTDAVAEAVGSEFTLGRAEDLTVLIDPLDHPWQLGWHRDRVSTIPVKARSSRFTAFLADHWHDPRWFHQVNAALRPDGCTWLVPRSHSRQQDLKGERQSLYRRRLRGQSWLAKSVGRPGAGDDELHDLCRRFPGAVQVELDPGDVLVYHQLNWHNGNYSPNRPRTTLHHVLHHPDSPPFEQAWATEVEVAIARYGWRRWVHEPIRSTKRFVFGRLGRPPKLGDRA